MLSKQWLMSTQHSQYVLLFSVLAVISDCLRTIEVNAIVFPSKLYMRTHSMRCRIHNETPVVIKSHHTGCVCAYFESLAVSHMYGVLCSLLGHGVELPFVFHTAPLGGYNYTHDELTLANTMVQYWTNFAHYGNPNGASSYTPSDGKQV